MSEKKATNCGKLQFPKLLSILDVLERSVRSNFGTQKCFESLHHHLKDIMWSGWSFIIDSLEFIKKLMI